MKINIELDKALEETEVLIRAAKMTEEVNGILKKLEEPSMQMISGFAGDKIGRASCRERVFRAV